MSYYVCHKKATLVRPPESGIRLSVYEETDFDEFDVPFSFFEPYIQWIDVPIVVKSVQIRDGNPGKGEREWEEARQSDLYAGLMVDTEPYPGGKTMFLYRHEKRRGFYVEDVYQEKLMATIDFTDVYEPGKNYASYEAFHSVVTYQDYSDREIYGWTKEEIKEGELNFHQKFLHEYEQGRSFLFYF